MCEVIIKCPRCKTEDAIEIAAPVPGMEVYEEPNAFFCAWCDFYFCREDL